MKINDEEVRMRFNDPSLWGVIIGNLVSIYFAFSQGWALSQIMWIYWGQSVIIGVMNVIRMLALKDFTTKGMSQNGEPVPETQAAKNGMAAFFAFHYGFFHFVYAVFLWEKQPLNALTMSEAVLMTWLGSVIPACLPASLITRANKSIS